MEPQCIRCMWSGDQALENRTVLVCRIYPPSVKGRGDAGARWPIVGKHEWCGKFQEEDDEAEAKEIK